jgi:hypothetical protein
MRPTSQMRSESDCISGRSEESFERGSQKGLIRGGSDSAQSCSRPSLSTRRQPCRVRSVAAQQSSQGKAHSTAAASIVAAAHHHQQSPTERGEHQRKENSQEERSTIKREKGSRPTSKSASSLTLQARLPPLAPASASHSLGLPAQTLAQAPPQHQTQQQGLRRGRAGQTQRHRQNLLLARQPDEQPHH